MTINEDVVDRNVDQQADKAHHHARFCFGQAFALISRDLKEQIAGSTPEQGA
ncbi:hypothetical protein D3C80_1692570 [compost metagenome]